MNKKGLRKISIGRSVVQVSAEREGRIHWGHEDVLNLVAKVGEHWHEFCNGIRKKKFIWKDIAVKLAHEGFTVTGDDCDRKWRNLKIRYMAVLEKQLSGEKTSHRIDYFDSIHAFLKDDPDTLAYIEQRRSQQDSKELVCHNALEEDVSDMTADGQMEWTDRSMQLLLDLLSEFSDWFTDKETDRDDNTIWETVSEQMKLEGYQPGPEHCKQKWASLALDFQHHKAEAEATGTVPLWPYYIRVRHVMNLVGLPKQDIEGGNTLKRRIRGTRNTSKKKNQRYFKQEVEDIDEGLLEEPSGKEILEMMEPSTSTGASAGSIKSTGVPDVTILPSEVKEICQRLERIEENMTICHRLDRLEAKLDDVGQQRETQLQTNALLNQILSELSRLSHTLSTRYHHQESGQDPTDLGSGITIVVPHSQHLE